MLEELAACRELVARNNRCKIYLGGSENQKFEYPYRLAPAHRVTMRIRDAAYELIVDSGITADSGVVDNEYVIRKANEVAADFVIPVDVFGEIDDTHRSLLEFLDLYDDIGCRSKIMVPIQTPSAEHYTRYEDFLSEFSHFALGGLKNRPPHEQVNAVNSFRDVAGENVHVHGLGMGTSEALVDALQTQDPFLDSLDVSTPERLPGRERLADASWSRERFETPCGKNTSTLNGILSKYMVYQLNYQLVDYADEDESAEAKNRQLHEFVPSAAQS